MALAFPEELKIGIYEVDDQHRSLYAQINQLHEAMRSHRLDQVVGTIEYLGRYASEHFATEERLMIEAGYPGFPDHLARHGQFKRDLKGWQERLAREGASAALVVDLSSWLTAWLREHIRGVDTKMAAFLRESPPKR